MTDQESPYASALRAFDEAAETLRLERAVLVAHRKLVNSLLHKLAGFDTASVSANRYGVAVRVNMTQLDGFKAPRLVRALAHFADGWRASTNDYPEGLNRDFRFVQPLEWPADLLAKFPDLYPHAELTVSICAYARSDSPTCRKVEVGRKRVVSVQKQYRIECS